MTSVERQAIAAALANLAGPGFDLRADYSAGPWQAPPFRWAVTNASGRPVVLACDPTAAATFLVALRRGNRNALRAVSERSCVRVRSLRTKLRAPVLIAPPAYEGYQVTITVGG